MITGLQLGRPGIYSVAERADTELRGVRLDVTGFVGVALRGPVDTPVFVASWSDFERQFGAFERPDNAPDRLLPFAVQAFFAQGGVRACIVRVAPPPPPEFAGPTSDEATARLALDPTQPGRWELAAKGEGTWGSALAVRLDFEVAQTFSATVDGPTILRLPAGTEPADQSVVRIRHRDLTVTGEFRLLTRRSDPASSDRVVTLDRALPDRPAAVAGDAGATAVEVDVITGALTIIDTGSPMRRDERLTGLGLAPGHPRFIGKHLVDESLLVCATGAWDQALLPDRFLTPRTAQLTNQGLDRSHGIDRRSFFDDGGADADPLDEAGHHRGVDAIGRVDELGLLCVPDLTWQAEMPKAARPTTVNVRPPQHCDACTPTVAELDLAEPPTIPRGLDASTTKGLAEIVWRQQRVVQIAELRRRFVALLDVPSGLPARRITDWRSTFDSSYAAAYHPWLGVPRRADDGGRCVSVPPSSFAAGIIAARERARGLPWGPANELARGAVLSAEVITDALHDQLHLLGINVYRSERDGFRLSSARTLSGDSDFRQLSVRRLMTMLALTLERQTQWLVFEPNTVQLRDRLLHTVTQFLRGLQRRGAFAGATEQQSFFVNCDEGLNPERTQRQGRLLAEIGVAPASPLEYIVVRISQDIDGSISVGSDRG